MFRRDLRLHLVAATGIAMAIPALAASIASTPQATQTTLQVDTRDINGKTQATLSMVVANADGIPASGSIAVTDQGKPLGGFVLNAAGSATATLELAPGDHALSAVYTGNLLHQGSRSTISPVHAVAGTTPDFSVSISPATLSLKQGQSGSALVSVAPVNAASLTAPMFVTISCSGLPDQTACTFTPENIEIPMGATSAINSSMVIATQSGTITTAKAVSLRESRPVAWAFLLPGALALAGFAFGMRRQRFINRVILLTLVAFVTMFGATACSPLYNYHNHGPTHNLPTPTGNYNVTIAAQSSNGVTATTHTTTIALTVMQ